MDPTALEQALLTVAARLDILVRWETFEGVFAQLRGRGGLCRLGGKQLIIGDASMSVIDRVGVLCEALSHVDTDGIAMLPLVREKIDRYRVRRGAVIKARPRHLKLVVLAHGVGLPRRGASATAWGFVHQRSASTNVTIQGTRKRGYPGPLS